MNIWRFYKKPDTKREDIPTNIAISDLYPLYAVTCKKDYAERFKEERNMDLFIVRKSKIEKGDYSEFANMNRSSVLDIHTLYTVENKYTKSHKVIDVDMLITEAEYRMTGDDAIINLTDESWWVNNTANPVLFNKKIRRALSYLDYEISFKLFCMAFDDDVDYSAPDWTMDSLAMFVNMYGELFKR